MCQSNCPILHTNLMRCKQMPKTRSNYPFQSTTAQCVLCYHLVWVPWCFDVGRRGIRRFVEVGRCTTVLHCVPTLLTFKGEDKNLNLYFFIKQSKIKKKLQSDHSRVFPPFCNLARLNNIASFFTFYRLKLLFLSILFLVGQYY